MAPDRCPGIFIGLGSNLGQVEDNLILAGSLLTDSGLIEIVRKSNVYYTEPIGFLEQPWFANQVLEVSIPGFWGAHDLFSRMVEVERTMGRKRTFHWGPRIIDLDLLIFHELIVNSPDLIVPHPRMRDRAFVLVPLFEISPEIVFPDGEALSETLKRLRFELDGQKIYQYQV